MAADNQIQMGAGGQYNANTSGGNGETALYSGAGRLCQVVIITAGTAAFSFYDGTQSTGGTLIYTSITNDTNGTTKAINMPVVNGIVYKGTTGSAGLAIGYNKNGVNGA